MLQEKSTFLRYQRTETVTYHFFLPKIGTSGQMTRCPQNSDFIIRLQQEHFRKINDKSFRIYLRCSYTFSAAADCTLDHRQ